MCLKHYYAFMNPGECTGSFILLLHKMILLLLCSIAYNQDIVFFTRYQVLKYTHLLWAAPFDKEQH